MKRRSKSCNLYHRFSVERSVKRSSLNFCLSDLPILQQRRHILIVFQSNQNNENETDYQALLLSPAIRHH